jgi:hypothetical protein
MLTVWGALLVIGAPIGIMGSGMAFDGGETPGAYLFVTTIWSFPVLVGIAFFLRKRNPSLVALPAIPLAILLLTAMFS